MKLKGVKVPFASIQRLLQNQRKNAAAGEVRFKTGGKRWKLVLGKAKGAKKLEVSSAKRKELTAENRAAVTKRVTAGRVGQAAS